MTDLWTGTDTCTVTVFGRLLANLKDADADYFRGWLASLDDCPDCTVWLHRHPACDKTIIRTEKGL